MKRSFLLIVCVLFSIINISCKNQDAVSNLLDIESIPERIIKTGDITVVGEGQAVTIRYELPDTINDSDVIYQWYEVKGDEEIIVENATENQFITKPFLKKGNISYFRCKVFNNDTKQEMDSSKISVIGYSGLPILFIDTKDGSDVEDRENWKEMNLTLLSNKYGNITIGGKIKGRGNTSWYFPKKPYTIKFSDNQSLLGMNEGKKFVLVNNYIDKSLLRNSFVSYIGNNIFNSHWQPSFEFCDVIFNGEYKGVYILGESIKIDKKRIDIQSLKKTVLGNGKDLNKDGIIDKEDGGFICEVNNKFDENYNFSINSSFPIVSLKDPDTDDFSIWTDELENYILEKTTAADAVLHEENWLDKELGYENKFDVDSFVDWYLTNEFVKNADSVAGPSIYFYYNPADDKIHFGPNWDFDACCGQYKGWFTDYDLYSPEGLWVLGGYKKRGDITVSTEWINRLFQDPSFVSIVKNRWNTKKALLYEAINTIIDNYVTEINVSAKLNFMLYPILGKKILNDYEAPDYEKRLNYQDEVDYLLVWLNDRYVWFDNAINSL